MKPTPLPFPLALNIGTDIVHLPRITRLVNRPGDYLTRFMRRILSEQEERDFRARFSLPPLNSPTRQQNKDTGIDATVTPDMARWLAGRFAAKEAGRKAAKGGAKAVGWKDVVVRVADGAAEGRPDVVLYDGGENGGRGRVGRLSISHDGEYVVATVLAAG
ncbi:hypothetical protein BDW74DRAFT_57666 [Aspergillus multicolor]|uniref:holo-ACP synthase n=1 Tax=Aspergillus multicolor TaxID=41759 RepID=UPI003CCE260C